LSSSIFFHHPFLFISPQSPQQLQVLPPDPLICPPRAFLPDSRFKFTFVLPAFRFPPLDLGGYDNVFLRCPVLTARIYSLCIIEAPIFLFLFLTNHTFLREKSIGGGGLLVGWGVGGGEVGGVFWGLVFLLLLVSGRGLLWGGVWGWGVGCCGWGGWLVGVWGSGVWVLFCGGVGGWSVWGWCVVWFICIPFSSPFFSPSLPDRPRWVTLFPSSPL